MSTPPTNHDHHSFEDASARQARDIAEVPAVEVITRAALMLMSASAEKLGLSSPDPATSPHRDLDEARLCGLQCVAQGDEHACAFSGGQCCVCGSGGCGAGDH